MSENYQSGTIPLPVDSIRIIEVKILNKLNQGGVAGGGQTYTAGAGVNPTGILTGTPGGSAINLTDGGIYWYYNGQWNP